MKKVSQTKQFSRDIKRLRKRGNDLQSLKAVVNLLADWILIYSAGKDFLRLERTGTHSDLFKK